MTAQQVEKSPHPCLHTPRWWRVTASRCRPRPLHGLLLQVVDVVGSWKNAGEQQRGRGHHAGRSTAVPFYFVSFRRPGRKSTYTGERCTQVLSRSGCAATSAPPYPHQNEGWRLLLISTPGRRPAVLPCGSAGSMIGYGTLSIATEFRYPFVWGLHAQRTALCGAPDGGRASLRAHHLQRRVHLVTSRGPGGGPGDQKDHSTFTRRTRWCCSATGSLRQTALRSRPAPALTSVLHRRAHVFQLPMPHC